MIEIWHDPLSVPHAPLLTGVSHAYYLFKCSAYCVGTIHYVEFRIIGSIYPYITELDPTIAMLTLCVLFSHLPANFFKISSVCV